MFIRAYFAFFLSCISVFCYCQESNSSLNASSSGAQNSSSVSIKALGGKAADSGGSANKAYETISALASAGKLNVNLANASIEVINNLLEAKRVDSDAIYKFSKSVSENLIAARVYLNEKHSSDLNYKNLNDCLMSAKDKVRSLRGLSYLDEIHSNKNISYFIESRLNGLVESSALLAAQDDKMLFKVEVCDDFLEELGTVQEKYKTTFRFRAGIGLNYVYLPSIRYFNSGDIDLTPYQSISERSTTHFAYGNKFSDKSYPGLILMADIGWVGVNLTIPSYSVSNDIFLPVRVIDSPDGAGGTYPYAMYKTSISSELSIDYDGYIRIDAFRLVDVLTNSSYPQISAGVLYGAIGFSINDKITSDLRRVDGAAPFNDLASMVEFKQSLTENYMSQYWGLFARFNLTDEWMLGLDYKVYFNAPNDLDRVEVGGRSFGFNVIYIPTGF